MAVTGKGTGARPQQRRAIRKDGWTMARRAIFLDQLAVTCNVRASARAAGMGKDSARILRARDGEFARLWAEAMAQGAVRLEEELLACALGQGPSGDNPAGERTEPEAPAFDPELALKVLSLRGRAAAGDRRHTGAAVPPSQAEVDALLMARLDEAAARLARR